MTNKSLSSIADDYFYSINPLAQRIGEDVAAAKEAYEGLWNTLTVSEKNQAIDETIIQPEVALKYTLKTLQTSKDLPEWYPKLRIQTGLKYVIDETGSTLRWRDEHSGPFSFMTQSQMNLNLPDGPESPAPKTTINYLANATRFTAPRIDDSSIESSLDDYGSPSDRLNYYRSDSYSDCVFESSDTGNSLDNRTIDDNGGGIFTKLMNKTSLLKMTNNSTANDDDDDTEILLRRKNICVRQVQKNTNVNKNQMNINLNNSRDTNESTALLETPSSYSSFQSSQTNQEDGIPKTGFEFLDNW